jgi:ATP-dependent Clp protease adaptor protein ClpS
MGIHDQSELSTHERTHSRTQSASAVQDAPPKPLTPWNVVLLDDDEHTYEYVIDMAMKIFGHDAQRAYTIAKTVDTQKRAVLFTSHKEHAELKRDQVHGFGKDFRMSISKGSMSAVLEPAMGDDNDPHNNATPPRA